MELKDFVANTLLAISEGIHYAKDKGKKYGLIVAPPITESGNIQKLKDGVQKPQTVSFNLKIVVESSEEEGKKDGSFSLQVMSISLSAKSGASANSIDSSSQIQEISFDIPVVWPTNFEQPEAGRAYSPSGEHNPFKNKF